CVIRHLFMLGEMAQLCPTQTPKRVFMLVQSLIAAPVIFDEADNHFAEKSSQTSDGNSEQQQGDNIQSSCQTSRISDTQRQTSDHITQDEAVQPTCQSSQSSKSQPSSQFSQTVFSQFRGSQMSGRIRAHAFITLGKMCLQNHDLAKRCVPAFARELEVSRDMAVRNNVVIIMADLSLR
ncbi:hypothetical protein LSH36_737g05069, partial [Paralvinella palmiformis]